MLAIDPVLLRRGLIPYRSRLREAAEGLDWNKFGKVIGMALLAAGGFYMICIYSFGTIIPVD